MMLQNPFYFHSEMGITRLVRLKTLGKDYKHDALVMYHRGKAFEGLKECCNDVANEAVVRAIVGCIALDASEILEFLWHLLTVCRASWVTAQQ
jgi:hypothetical protein